MKLKTNVREIPAVTEATAGGMLFSIPCEDFIDPEQPRQVISLAMEKGHIFCEYDAPIIKPCQTVADAIDATVRVRSVDTSRVCGYVSYFSWGVVEDQFQFNGAFTPYGPLKSLAIELMRSGTITISPRILLDPDGKIVCIASFDVVAEETPRYQFVRTVR